jgi:nucleotide-binding universal stress UspA family protein
MFHHILVPLDGSSRAEQALPVASRLVHASGGRLTLLKVITPLFEADLSPVQLRHVELPLDAEVAKANAYLTQVISTSDLEGIDIRPEALTGPAAQTILLCAQLQNVDLIVICSHGFTGFKRWRLGSVAQHVAQQSPVPVLVLREGGAVPVAEHEGSQQPVRVLVALDGSQLAEATLAPAEHLSALLSAPAHGVLHLIRVLPFPELEEGSQEEIFLATRKQAEAHVREYLDKVTQQLRESDLAQLYLTVSTSVVARPDVADTLICVAEHGEYVTDSEGFAGCDVIAMAIHGRGGLQRWAMGSITERVLGATKLPLLIVRSHQPQAQEQTSTAQAEGR